MATGSSMYSMPFSAHRSTSDWLMGREASDMWVSPAQNFLNPPPVPETPTVILTSPPVAMPNSSAMASVMGNTVLEPSMLMSPDSWARFIAGADWAGCRVWVSGAAAVGAGVAVGSLPPQAATARVRMPVSRRIAKAETLTGTRFKLNRIILSEAPFVVAGGCYRAGRRGNRGPPARWGDPRCRGCFLRCAGAAGRHRMPDFRWGGRRWPD